jgi:hypothetical protein
MRTGRFASRAIGAALGAFAASVAYEAHAEQFILIDATFDYTWDDAMNAKPDKSHYYVNESNFLNKNRPTNWLSPIDYRNGTLHVRTEVFKKPPGDQTVGWTLCYIPNAGGYGCADTTYYTSTGVFDRETKMTDWWNNNQLQWDKGIKQVDLIYAINDSGSGHITNYPALKDLTTPTRVRITMVQVSAGAKYDPSIIDLMNGDAGHDAGDASWGSWEGGADASSGAGGSGGAGTGATTGGMGGLLGVGGMGGAAAGSSSTASTSSSTSSGTGTGTSTTSGAGGDSTTSNGSGPRGADSLSGCAIATRPPGGYSVIASGAIFALLACLRRGRRSRA